MDALPITFLSDYGLRDEFAGVCRAVVLRISPHSQVIDLTHGIVPGAVGAGALVLAGALPYTPPGVHVAIVDPAVGTQRRAIAVRVADEDRVLVGPDNGLLMPAIEQLGGAVEAVEISSSPARLLPVSPTFHGRDIFSPVAASIAAGSSLSHHGPELDPARLIQITLPKPFIGPGRIVAHASAVDRFGNIRLDCESKSMDEAGFGFGNRLEIRVGESSQYAVAGRTFADSQPGSLVVYRGSNGTLAIAANRGSAAAILDIEAGAEIEISAT